VQGPTGVFESCLTNYKIAGNVIIGGNRWPAKNFVVKKAGEVGFKAVEKDQVSDYRLEPGSRYKGGATDQKDVGANVDAIEAATKDVF
jgi:hypothetical protein